MVMLAMGRGVCMSSSKSTRPDPASISTADEAEVDTAPAGAEVPNNSVKATNRVAIFLKKGHSHPRYQMGVVSPLFSALIRAGLFVDISGDLFKHLRH